MVMWKITMKSGKSYIVQSIETNVKAFMHMLINNGGYSDFTLAKEYSDSNYKFNTIMINSQDVSTVEYYIQ